MPQDPSLQLPSSSPDLFGKDDSEFLDALANVDVPLVDQKLLDVTKEESQSSELFGTEDPAFLDALSKNAFPDHMEQELQPPVGPSAQTSVKTQNLGTQARKRSRSSDHHIDSVVLDPESLQSSSTTPKNGSLYESDIYGPSKFHGFGEYMSRKRAKLHIQNADMGESAEGKKSTLFQGLALHVNGKTNPSVQELRKLIIQHGGIFHPYLDRKKMLTHVIASNLTPAKVLEFKNMKVVTPAWLLDSIRAGNLLPWREYMIGADRRTDQSQGRATTSLEPACDENPDSPKQQKQTEINQQILQPDHEREITVPTSNVSPSKITRSSADIFSKNPSTSEQAARVPSYAPSGSNPHAKRKMEDPEWRAAHTAVASGFIEGYYKNSRLHHLSMWKSELQELVAKAVECVENGEMLEQFAHEDDLNETGIPDINFHKPMSPMKGKEKAADTRIIMHCDFDSFFVSAGIIDRPHLKGKPVVVCHSQGEQGGTSSTSEIASSSYEARKFGIKSGMSLGQAKKLCPGIHTIPYEFERYKHISLQFYTILMSYADDLQAVSVDEALIDVTSTVESARRTASTRGVSRPLPDFATKLAETMRTKIRRVTGCEVSIGISHNILLARIATRRAKPAGSYYLQPEEVSDVLAPLNVEELWGFGRSTRNKLEAKFGVTTLGELARHSKGTLCDVLGKKTGETLWKAIRGIDDTKIESDHVRKSVSSEINYAIRFNDNEDAQNFIRKMAAEVSRRLVKIGMCGRSLTLKIMTRDAEAPVEAPKFLGHGICNTTSKTSVLVDVGGQATADENIIGECAWRLLKGMNLDPKELRGIGIHVQKLERQPDVNGSRVIPDSHGQSVLLFEKRCDSTGREEPSHLMAVIDPPSQDVAGDFPSSPHGTKYDTVGVLPSISQVDPSFLDALPAEIRHELEQEYAKVGSGLGAAGPSRYKSPEAHLETPHKSPSDGNTRASLSRITRQLAPKSRPSISPSKRMHPLFTRRKAPVSLKVKPAELKLLDIDPEVWVGLPVELQREQLAAFRAANVGTGMAVRASMSTQAKQERILNRWRLMWRRSPSVGVRGRRPQVSANPLQLPQLKQRGKGKGQELKASETDDIQAVIGQWVRHFEEDGPRLGDVEYFGKFLVRCAETDVGAEKAVSALKWWRILLRQRWADMEQVLGESEDSFELQTRKVGQDWWHAFWDVKERMDLVIRKRFGGKISLK